MGLDADPGGAKLRTVSASQVVFIKIAHWKANMKVNRNNNRLLDEIRPWSITRGVLDYAEGSALIEAGRTKVICAATVEDRIPSFLKGTGKGWVTAEVLHASALNSYEVLQGKRRQARGAYHGDPKADRKIAAQHNGFDSDR